MILIDHIACGILLSNSYSRIKNVTSIIFCIMGTIIPDLLVILGGPGTMVYLIHRKFTNSLLLAPLYCIIPLIIFLLFIKKYVKTSALTIYLATILGYSSHIILDLVTPYGTQLFYPFSMEIFSFDLYHSFDPIFMIISTCTCIYFLAKIKNRKYLPKTIIAVLIGFYCLYFIYTGVSKSVASSKYSSYSSTYLYNASYVDTIPRTFWRWKGIAGNSNNHYVLSMNNHEIHCEEFSKELELPDNIMNDKYTLQFLEYARYPATICQENEFNLVNLIYSTKSYRLTFKTNFMGEIIDKKISNFDLKDR